MRIIQTDKVNITTYLIPSKKPLPVVVICPGGGYEWRSERESGPVAKAFNKAGFHAVIVNYTVAKPELRDLPLIDLSQSVSYLRNNAIELAIDPDHIIVMGFSAGGHLAASLGVFWNDKERFPDELTRTLHRPNGLILCYPVITAGEYAHRGSFNHLTVDTNTQMEYSLELKVTDQVPPSFLWHTMTDSSVPVENSLLFLQQLRKYGVSCEAMFFPKGDHGLSLATKEVEEESKKRMADTHIARWFDQCIHWIHYEILKESE